VGNCPPKFNIRPFRTGNVEYIINGLGILLRKNYVLYISVYIGREYPILIPILQTYGRLLMRIIIRGNIWAYETSLIPPLFFPLKCMYHDRNMEDYLYAFSQKEKFGDIQLV
jgi:hypothetical protein